MSIESPTRLDRLRLTNTCRGYNPTIEDSYRKQVVVNDEAVTLEILDTAGQGESYRLYPRSTPHFLFTQLVDKRLGRGTSECQADISKEEYAAMADQWYKYANGFLLVYSITDRVSFENCLLLHQDILRVKDRPFVPIIVVSNKVSHDFLSA